MRRGFRRREIRKRAGDKNFVQVLLLSRNVETLGQRRYWPILRGGAGDRLTVRHPCGRLRRQSAHPSGGRVSTSRRWSTRTVPADRCSQAWCAKDVFERYPKLKMVMIEAGSAGRRAGWRLDKNFERLHSEGPYLKRKPSEYIRDHIWWTTQPMKIRRRRDICFRCEWIGWDKLLFATDYPHWDFDEPSRVLPAGVSDATAKRFISATRRSCTVFLMVRHVMPRWTSFRGDAKFLTIDERPIAIFNIKGEFFGC